MATIGMLSGLATIRRKFGSRVDRDTKIAASTPTTSPTFGRQKDRRAMRTKNATAASVMKIGGLVRKLTTSLTALTAPMCSRSPLQRPRDAAVLAHAPEVDGHEDAGHERDAHAVEHVEAQERALADEAPAEEGEARVGPRVHHLHVAQSQELRAGALVPEHRRSAGHVRADGDGPDRELVPRQQVPGEGEEQGQHEEDDADVPVELAGRLVGPGHE